AGGGPGPPREPVLGAELVEDGAPDPGPRVPLEPRAAVAPVAAERVEEPEDPGGEQVVALDVGGQPPREPPDHPLQGRQVRIHAPLPRGLLVIRGRGARALALAGTAVPCRTFRTRSTPPRGRLWSHGSAHREGFLTQERRRASRTKGRLQ